MQTITPPSVQHKGRQVPGTLYWSPSVHAIELLLQPAKGPPIALGWLTYEQLNLAPKITMDWDMLRQVQPFLP